ncbi:MAG: hypothetical protein QM763_10420 [Agriterribacter sp.]
MKLFFTSFLSITIAALQVQSSRKISSVHDTAHITEMYKPLNGVKYNHNTGEMLTDARGGAWLRQGNDLEVDWWIPATAAADTADKTSYIQEALNNAFGKKLHFTRGRKYRTKGVYISDNTTIDFNYAEIEAYSCMGQDNNVLFRYQPVRMDFNGKYAAGIFKASKQKRKHFKGTKLMNGIFYGNNYNISCIQLEAGSAWYTSVDSFEVEHCIAYNFSSKSFAISGNAYITDSVCNINYVNIHDSKSYYSGKNIGLYVAKPAAAGDTSLLIRTIDKTSITKRVGLGQYIQFGAAGNNTTIQNTGYGTTNKIYRIKKIKIDVNDNTQARIDIAGGGYSSKDGFIDSVIGLTANIVANTFILPVEAWGYPALMRLPNFNGTAGARKVQRLAGSGQEDAYMKNLWVGQSICFANQPGNFIVTGIYGNDSITFTPALSASFTNQRMILNGWPGDGLYLNGYIKSVVVERNLFYSGGHAIAIAGSSGKDIYQEDAGTSQIFRNNEFWYNWMSVEMTNGTNSLFTINKTGLDNRSVTKGDTVFVVGNSSSYRIGTKDIDNDGVADVALTNSTAKDADITQQNALFAGEIFGMPALHYRYKVTGIIMDGAVIKLIMQRWDQQLRKTVPGGFEKSLSNVRELRRIWTLSSGEPGSVSYQEWVDNKFNYTWRNGSGAGYHISSRAYEMLVEGNEFKDAERGAIEISGYGLRFLNNKLMYETFLGDKIVPGLSVRNNTSGKSAGGWGTFFSGKLDIVGNQATFSQPVAATSADYSFFTGRFNLAPQQHTLHVAEKFNFSNNIVSGVRSSLFTTNESEGFAGRDNAPFFYYDSVMINNNTFRLPDDYMNTGFFKFIFSDNTEIKGNIFEINTSFTQPFNIFPNNTILNYNLFDSTGSYNIVIKNNKYIGKPVLNTYFPATRIKWNDK